ncbi:hypothetical protein GWK47_037028 [Chionoecetes opilio]|uniref:Uncharacterized protein n=1 Tax=Chionoecetes opilio TaxID=41210 RepID=A0A8J4YDT8_CHIOP|nr:hypothetical protein GWK47_037028 [Chionoecetes opilio]
MFPGLLLPGACSQHGGRLFSDPASTQWQLPPWQLLWLSLFNGDCCTTSRQLQTLPPPQNGEAGVATVGHIDNRFFRLKSYVGDTDVRIKHTVTDLHIQATSNGVSLNSADPLAAEGMRFYAYNCTTT